MGLQFKYYERVPHRPNTEPEPYTEGVEPRGAVLREVRRGQYAYSVPGTEEGALALPQGPPRERSRYVYKVRSEHGAHRRRTRASVGEPLTWFSLLSIGFQLSAFLEANALSIVSGPHRGRSWASRPKRWQSLASSRWRVHPGTRSQRYRRTGRTDLLAVGMSCPERQPLVLTPAHPQLGIFSNGLQPLTEPYRSSPARRGSSSMLWTRSVPHSSLRAGSCTADG